MRVLGVTPSSVDVSWALIEGTRAAPALVNIESTKQKFPTTQSETQILQDLYHFASSFLKSQSIEKVCILQAGISKFGKSSAVRIKTEAAFQLACAESNIPVVIVAPQTLRALEKKFQAITGDMPEQILNGGEEFKPKPWKDAVMVAWIGLEA